MSGISEIDQQTILEGINELADGDSPPTLSEFNEYGPASKTTIYRHFESWNEALGQAGYNQPTEVSRKEILDTIRQLADGDTPPSLSEFVEVSRASRNTVYNNFESWNEAVRQAGYKPNQRTEVNREEILEAIRDLADGDTPPTSEDYEEDGPTSLHLVYDYFDSWPDAVATAGFEPKVWHNLSREAVIESVQKVAKELGRPPKAAEFDEQGITSSCVAKKRCGGTWETVIEEAGYDYTSNGYTREELIEEIHRLADKHGQAPTQAHINDGEYSVGSYRHRWGTYNNALNEAGYEPRDFKMTEEEVVDRLQAIAVELERTPRVQDINGSSRISERPVLDKFGSWWAGLVRAGLRPQKPRPLRPEAFLRLHDAAVGERNSNPMWSITTLLLQFTGLTRDALAAMTGDWIQELADEYVISIPREYTKTDSRWEFRLPETWHSAKDGSKRPTHLPESLVWYFEGHDSLFDKPRSVHRILYRIASRADLDEFREVYDERHGVENAPRVRPTDLRVTHGLQLARNSAPSELIRRRLGLDAAGSHIDVRELFVWLDEREDFHHPEYNNNRPW
jgi:transposase